MSKAMESVEVNLGGRIKDISATLTTVEIDENGKLSSQEIITYVRLEVNSEVKTIRFYGYLPSQLVGKEVTYHGMARSDALLGDGREIQQVFFRNSDQAYFMGTFKNRSLKKVLSKQELKSLLVSEK